MLKFKPGKLLAQYFAKPEIAFQMRNWQIFLDFLGNFWLFFLLISSFLDLLAVFCQKSVNMATSL